MQRPVLRLRGSRTLSVVLLLSLLAAAVVLSIIGSDLGSSPFQAEAPPPAAPKTAHSTPSTGTLLVRAYLVRNGTLEAFIANASVSVTNSNNPAQARSVLRTNQSGELQMALSPAEYSVSISNQQFQASTQAQVYSHNTTVVEAAVTRKSYGVSIAELSDDSSSGYQSPWAPVSLSINSSSTIFKVNSLVFIDGNYSYGPIGVLYNNTLVIHRSRETQVETPATVVSSDLRISERGDVLWLTVLPVQFMPVSDLRSMTLATYSANLVVMVHGS